MANISPHSLDPQDWQELREQGHKMLDDMFDYLEHIEERPVWQPIPEAVRESCNRPLPQKPASLASAHEYFMRSILPYAVGNAHPGFMGWVHGGGTPVGMLAEMLAAGLNANIGGRDQMPVEIEREVARWMSELFAFPKNSSGIFVTGTSMANLVALWVARTRALGENVRKSGLEGAKLCAYASSSAHGSISRGFDLAGFGSAALRIVPCDEEFRMDLDLLRKLIAEDRAAGFTPFFVAATAGTVDTGAIDDLARLGEIARQENLWFHVDGAYGALAMLSPALAPRLRGIEGADSIAFDFHKWGQVPYDAGFILIRDSEQHRAAFASPATYLRRENSGLAGGSPWPCDFGPDLSRSFRALKTWFTFTVFGAEKIGETILQTCELARELRDRILAAPELELLAPVSLNIVCFGYRAEDPDRVNAQIALKLQESGVAAPSTTTIGGRLAIRAAIVNHRTKSENLDALIAAAIAFGKDIAR